MIRSLIEKFKNGETAKNSLIALALKILGVGFLFALTLFLTNNFSAELVGQFSFSRSVLLILGGISIIGAEQSIIYYAGFLNSKNSINNLKSVYLKTLKLILVASISLLIIISLINKEFVNSAFEIENPYELIQKVTYYVFFHSVMMLNIEVFRALNKIVLSEFYRNIMRFLVFFIAAYFLLVYHVEDWIVDAFLGSYIILAIITSIQAYGMLKKLGSENKELRITSREIFKTSYPMALNAMTFFLLQSVGVILLGKFEDFDTVAYYDTAVRLATLTSLGVMSVNIAIAPKISEEYNKGNLIRLKKIYKSAVKLMFILSMPAILFLFLFADFTLGLFGEGYQSAKTALYILVLAQFLTTLMGISGTYMNMTGKQNILHKILMFACVLNVLLNYLLIPKLGINGAAVAAGLSMIVWHLIAAIVIYKKDKISLI